MTIDTIRLGFCILLTITGMLAFFLAENEEYEEEFTDGEDVFPPVQPLLE